MPFTRFVHVRVTMRLYPCLVTKLDSPRLYRSTNPWKTTSEFHCVTETKEDYLAIIQKLKEEGPAPNQKRQTKADKWHLTLLGTLESRLEAIDAEIAVSEICGT